MSPAATLAVAVGALVVLVSGCMGGDSSGAEESTPRTPTVRVPADRPPSPATWPLYPSGWPHSCWSRPTGEDVLSAAPSAAPAAGVAPTPPAEIVRRLLARFGDRRFIRRIELGPPPPITLQHLKGWFAGAHPPADALWAYVSAPAASRKPEDPTPEQARAWTIAQWQFDLVAGALRDDFCAASGPPLVGASIGRRVNFVSDSLHAFGQRFPSPAPQEFRARVKLVGRRYGFRVLSLRLLRPRELAPFLVVETDRERKRFAADVPAIVSLLNPTSAADARSGATFVVLFIEARDEDGPFLRVFTVRRGEVMGGQWAWDRCAFPYSHFELLGAEPCP